MGLYAAVLRAVISQVYNPNDCGKDWLPWILYETQ